MGKKPKPRGAGAGGSSSSTMPPSTPNFVQAMRDGTQAALDAHAARIGQDATARQLLPLQQQRAAIRAGLIQYGTDCDYNDADKFGDGDQSPIATLEGRAFARNLWSTGADFGAMMQQRAFSPMAIGAMHGNVTLVETMLRIADYTSENGRPSEALLNCLESRESSLRLSPLTMIVSLGKNINEAAGLRKGQEDCARLLLKYGARPDARDVVGKTVVHYGAGKLANETSIKIVDMCIRAQPSTHLFGKEVEMFGLSSGAMNGMRGIGRGFVEENNRRAVFLLDSKKEVAVKPENIRLVVVPLHDEQKHATGGTATSATGGTATIDGHAQPAATTTTMTPLVDMQDRLGSVALHELVMSNRDDVAKFLLFQHNASYDVVELDAGCTPWKMATINTCLSAVCPVVVAAGVKRGRQQQKEAAKKCRHCGKMEGSDNDNKPLMVCSKCKIAQYVSDSYRSK
jgi:hypothetical protein